MTLDKLRPLVEQFIQPSVRVFEWLKIGPNGVSVLALVCAILAAFAFGFGEQIPLFYLLGAALVFANGWLDLVDGALARVQGQDSPAGDLLDHVLDRYADIIIIGGLAAGLDAYLLGFLAITGVLMTSYLGTQAMAVGLDRVYGGAVGRADRLALIGVTAVIMSMVPDPIGGLTLVEWLLVLLAVLGHLTAVQRFGHAYRSLT